MTLSGFSQKSAHFCSMHYSTTRTKKEQQKHKSTTVCNLVMKKQKWMCIERVIDFPLTLTSSLQMFVWLPLFYLGRTYPTQKKFLGLSRDLTRKTTHTEQPPLQKIPPDNSHHVKNWADKRKFLTNKKNEEIKIYGNSIYIPKYE